MTKLETVIRTLVAEEALDHRYRDHILSGNWKGYRECHVEPDWLLIYRVNENQLELVRTGSHSD
jgi:mRNA interferase YafQ